MSLDEKIQARYNQIKNFPQYKTKSKKEVWEVARKSIEEKKEEEQNEIEWIGLTDEEIPKANKLFDQFKEKYQITKFSDIDDLKRLVISMVIEGRLNLIMQGLADENTFVGKDILDALKVVQNQIVSFKKRLGLGEEKKESKWKIFWVNFKQKINNYANTHKGAFYFKCIAEGSLILMADWTLKPIERIKIGEEIFGVKKIPKKGWILTKQKVLNKFFKGFQEVVSISTDKQSLILTPDHEILANRRRKRTYFGYYKAENSFNRDVILFEGIKKIEDYYKGVLLGFMKSDGWGYECEDKNHLNWNFTRKYFICQQIESDSVEFLLNYFNFEYSKKYYNKRFGNGAYTFSISTKHTKFIDSIFKKLQINNDVALGFIVGFALGGDYYQNFGFLIHQSLENKKNIQLLDFVLDKLNIKVKKIFMKDQMVHYRIMDLEIPFIVPFSKKSKQLNNGLLNNRKRGIFNKKFYKITNVSFCGITKVWDLTTEVHNFIANGFIVHKKWRYY